MDLVTLGIIGVVGLLVTVGVVFFVRFLDQSKTSSAPGPAAPPSPSPPVTPSDEVSGSERRQAPRRKGSSVSVLITDEYHPTPYRGWVVDRSTTGLRLEIDEPKQPGAILQLKPADAPQATSWVPVEVKYCRREGNVHHVGCQFLHTPPWNVLLLFG